jgi:hypothetical protein
MREGLDMEIKWRTIQFILDKEGVNEVEVDYEDASKIRCSCKSFSRLLKCKHAKFVRNLMEENDGQYSINIPVDIDDDTAIAAMTSKDSFRDFILKYGKVEVID